MSSQRAHRYRGILDAMTEESEARSVVRNRRKSPNVTLSRRYDEVDAPGYLDVIEKVGRETVVVVFVYDAEVCPFPFARLFRYTLSVRMRPSTNYSPPSPQR